MVLGGQAEGEFRKIEASLADKKHPADWTQGETFPVVSVIASSADRKIVLIENGGIVAESALTVAGGGSLGNHVFVLAGPHAGSRGMSWSVISHGGQAGTSEAPEKASATVAFRRQFCDQRCVTRCIPAWSSS